MPPVSEQFSRSALLLGATGVARLQQARVALFGVGGVGGHAAEALIRAGVGTLTLIDGDTISPSNLNRQYCATHATIGQVKVEAMKERLLQINPKAEIVTHALMATEDNLHSFNLGTFSHVIDAIDTLSAKIAIAVACYAASVPLIASMGAGNKLDPTRFEVADIYATTVCPLAKVMRRELRLRGIPALRVVYSREPPIKPLQTGCDGSNAKRAPGSVPFVPPVAGLILAGEVIKSLALHVM